MAEVKAGIINVSGYAGVELARLLYRHPKLKLVSVTGRSTAGKMLGEVFPHLGNIELEITGEIDPAVDVVFSAMPHKESVSVLLPLIQKGMTVVDISADFRLKKANLYEEWYGFTHPVPDLLKQAVYGLPELYRSKIKQTKLVANPGCYPTSAILAMTPAAKNGLIEKDIIFDSKSGASGAGRTLRINTHYSEMNEDVSAYGLSGHRHLPEIVQELSRLDAKFQPEITFVPHLMPMTRGILTTAYAKIAPGKLEVSRNGQAKLMEIYREFYRDEPFVRVVAEPPHTKQTYGSNYCLIHPSIDLRTGRLVVVSVIDNLVKGAAGQAIQNMNLMLGYEETTGLDALAVYP